ncbi:ribosome hibernation-promoting factor, HPF/YfiA family [Parafrigoribacterium soli]|uniref:ribosome hibernation-promoting factor, HPF/YfiA family n=1 Tax=Parafrigoribacterium soli TaxID=3144663 RepID=UPI0032EAB1C7
MHVVLRTSLVAALAVARDPVLDALAVLLPVECAGCGAPDRALCPACRTALSPRVTRRELRDGTVVFAALGYDGVVRQSILALKRNGRTDVARALAVPLAAAVAAALRDTTHQAVELAPVAPARAAFRRRGYDPLALLLKRARLRPSGPLRWVHDHAQQKSLDRAERESNLVGAMGARGALDGRAFILVDDIVTTGATLREASRAITAAGGEVLCAVALANTASRIDDFDCSRRKLVTSPDDGATVGKRGALVIPGSAGVTRHGSREDAMDISINGRNLGITDRFRDYATEKAEKIAHLADKALAFEVKVSRHAEKNGSSGDDRVELMVIGPGPLVRAESTGSDKYVAFDLALDKLVERVRRMKDRQKVHRGKRRPTSLREASADGFSVIDIQPATPETMEKVRTGSIEVIDNATADAEEDDWSPVVIRKKVFPAAPMTVDDALYYMELVGHDFYLFIDAETDRPSVVYRRKGWDYGVIGLDTEADEVPAAARARNR